MFGKYQIQQPTLNKLLLFIIITFFGKRKSPRSGKITSHLPSDIPMTITIALTYTHKEI
jgi:hypothetical protein